MCLNVLVQLNNLNSKFMLLVNWNSKYITDYVESLS